ncbi:hypothetical protein [Variovorax sp. UMC13]|uniref:hypothetical protein n=1 Tax=Variovorax sp. UMC13 TaxID=1862326 RepID=UPI0016035111|nr:hypothetical protein [Variovorax sp. UMC13]MBB1599940.1 hypothetical protein [Variovorax sp. UMC13]
MIRITSHTGTTHYVAPAAIAEIVEAGASSQWHGIRSVVRLFDGRVIEASETAEQIARAAAATGASS